MSLLRGKISIFAVAAPVYLIGQYFFGAWFPYFVWPFHCYLVRSGAVSYCDPVYIYSLGEPLIEVGKVLFFNASLLLFANESGFNKWLRFSYWFVPIAVIILIFFTPIAVPLGEIDTYIVTKWFGALYIFVTFYIVAISRLHTHKKDVS